MKRVRRPTSRGTAANNNATNGTSTDLEAGCSTKEEASSSGGNGSSSNTPPSNSTAREGNKKNDDGASTFTASTASTSNYSNTSLAVVSLHSYQARCTVLYQGIKATTLDYLSVLPNKRWRICAGIYLLACLCCSRVMYHYLSFLYGRIVASVGALAVASIFSVTTTAVLHQMRSSQDELEEILEQEGRSRAILNSLYPANILEQMYAELLPEQILEAQYEVQVQLLEQQQQHEQQEQQQAFLGDGPTTQGPTASRIVVEVDRKILGYGEETTITPTAGINTNNSGMSSNTKTPLMGNTSTRSAVSIHSNTNNNNNNSSRTRNVSPQRPRHQAPLRPHTAPPNINIDLSCNTLNTANTSEQGGGGNGGGGGVVPATAHQRKRSMNMRRQSMSKRASLAQGRRCSLSFRRRRSSGGSMKSVSSIASSQGRPIHDKYDNCCVLFADVVGFTQWCSDRDPSHVFQLLEAIFFAFDNLARALKVYKIETIGDCYLAVTGLPRPQDDCCTIMAQFACQIIQEFDVVVAGLRDVLGEDTGSLRLRVGCHSGPVTAGVLRGDKGRFQLFGDSVNTAARMESNGKPGRVQISSDMARQLALAGKHHWYATGDKITAKGKGEMQCYWLKDHIEKRTLSRKPSRATSIWMHLEDVINLQEKKLQEGCFEQMEVLIKKVVMSSKQETKPTPRRESLDSSISSQESDRRPVDLEEPLEYIEPEGTILDELRARAIFDDQMEPDDDVPLRTPAELKAFDLPIRVTVELQVFVKELCGNYQGNPFHCFLHASHMARSMVDLLDHLEESNLLVQEDPMLQFVILLASMVGDADNPGVSNHQLMQESAEMAEHFNHTGLYQQNALDVAWDLLTGDTCQNLLKAVCSNSQSELKRLRKYMVHALMATDSEDRDLRLARFQRWKCADYMTSAEQSIVIIEQCMQLSALVHNVQGSEFFMNWSERSFREQYLAYIKGRREKDPCSHFLEDQLQCFLQDVIPLAERFNVQPGTTADRRHAVLGSCSELLRQARINMKLWELSGRDRVKEMARSAKYEFGEKQSQLGACKET